MTAKRALCSPPDRVSTTTAVDASAASSVGKVPSSKSLRAVANLIDLSCSAVVFSDSATEKTRSVLPLSVPGSVGLRCRSDDAPRSSEPPSASKAACTLRCAAASWSAAADT